MKALRPNTWLAIGAGNGFLAVAAGAFGAHGLQSRAAAAALAAYETGAHYHLVHALAIILTSFVLQSTGSRLAGFAAVSFLLGIVLFSGSLYFLGVTQSAALVLFTPVGGLAFLAGWFLLGFAAIRTAD